MPESKTAKQLQELADATNIQIIMRESKTEKHWLQELADATNIQIIMRESTESKTAKQLQELADAERKRSFMVAEAKAEDVLRKWAIGELHPLLPRVYMGRNVYDVVDSLLQFPLEVDLITEALDSTHPSPALNVKAFANEFIIRRKCVDERVRRLVTMGIISAEEAKWGYPLPS